MPTIRTKGDQRGRRFDDDVLLHSGNSPPHEESMVEIVHLASFKRRQAARRGFKAWLRRFSEPLDEETRIADLSDRTLAFLISPGEENIFLLYELVMGVKDLGTSSDFFNLDRALKMEVIDISIYVLDQLRFECMRRLNWLASDCLPRLSLVELVEYYPTLTGDGRRMIPALGASHPNYETYTRLSEFEKETFVRKQIPAAIERFKSGLKA